MKFLSVIICCLCLANSLRGQDWIWAHQQSSGEVPIGAVGIISETDNQGNVYIAGEVNGNTNFGAGFVSPSSDRGFIMKYNPFGEIAWVQYFSELSIVDVHVNHQGEVTLALATSYDPTIELPDTTLIFPTPFKGTVLLTFDYLGNTLELNLIYDLVSGDVKADQSGGWFLAGEFQDTLTASGDVIISNGSTGVFFAKVSHSGQVLALYDIPKIGDIKLKHFLASPEALYLYVSIQDTVFWAGDTLVNQALDTSPWNFDRLILRYDMASGEDWALHVQNQTVIQPSFGTRGFIQTFEGSLDENENLYTSVRMRGVIELGNTSFTFDEPRTWTYVFKISSNGQLIWEKALEPTTSAIIINETSISPLSSKYMEGGLIMGGIINEGVKVGADTTLMTSLVSPYATGQHFVLMKLSASNGDFQWINSVAGPSVPISIWDLSVSNTGNIHVAGSLSSGIAPLSSTLSLIQPSTTISLGLFSGILVDTSFYNFQQQIYGRSYADENLNCILDSNEYDLPQIPIVALPGPYFGVSDLDGKYKLAVDTGLYQVRQLNLNASGVLGDPYCPTDSVGHTVSLNSGQDTFDINFSNDVEICPHLIVLATASFHRRCYAGELQLQVLNQGILDADSITLHVEFPQFISLTTANYPFVFDSTNLTYSFDLGQIPALGSKQIQISDSVSCGNINILGQTQCIKAFVTPSNQSFGCFSPNPNWSGANLVASGICIGNDTARFTIYNDATFDMTEARTFKIFRSDTLIYIDTLSLLANEDQIVDVYAAGKDVRLEMDQVADHPEVLRVVTGVEGCDSTSSFLIVYEENLLANNISDNISICDDIIGSFDPNEKYSSPVGFGDSHIIEPATPIRYSIHFQNTGTDTAFKIVIVDTLAPELDLGSLVVLGSSHPYTLDISGIGRPVLSFSFDPIQLPDSNTNLLGSMGHINFLIQPYENVPLRTVVDNQAEIYFDFNPPIATGIVSHTIDTLPLFYTPSLVSIPKDSLDTDTTTTAIEITSSVLKKGFYLYPNPNNGKFRVQVDPIQQQIPIKLEFFTGQGSLIKEYLLPKELDQTEIDLSALPSGMYFLRVGALGVEKFILIKE